MSLVPLNYKIFIAEKYKELHMKFVNSYNPFALLSDFFYLLLASAIFQVRPSASFNFMYYRIRKLYNVTNGKANNLLSFLLTCLFKPKYKFSDINGILGNYSDKQLKNISNEVKENGYYAFETKLDPKLCDSLIQFALSTPCTTDFKEHGIQKNYDPHNPISNRYHLGYQNICENEIVQQIYTDSSILALAQEYLGSLPVLLGVGMWWSTYKHKSEEQNMAAQLYHQDSDGVKWIKFFIYLKDVDEGAGPHCLVKGSHKKIPKKFWSAKRYSDKEVEEWYGKENIKIQTGKKGTIIMVDTHTLHKGIPPQNKDRLILELQYLNFHFDKDHYNRKIYVNDKFRFSTVEFIKKHRGIFPEYNFILS